MHAKLRNPKPTCKPSSITCYLAHQVTMQNHPPTSLLPTHIPYSRSLQQRLYLLTQHLLQRHSPTASRRTTQRHLDQLHAQLLLNGFSHKRFVLAKLISLATAAADLSRATAFFLSAPSPSTTLCNLLLRAAGRLSPSPHHPLLLFSRLLRCRHFRPNAFSYCSLLAACAAAGGGRPLLLPGRVLHARALAAGFAPSPHLLTSLLSLYAAVGQEGSLLDARKVFDEMANRTAVSWNCMLAAYVRAGELDAALGFFGGMPKRDVVAWTTVIAGCARAGRAVEAVELFRRMRRARVADDEVTMVALLSACAGLGDLQLGRWVHARVDRGGREQRPVSLDNALMHMYVRCGVVEDARRVFLEMPKRSTASWTTMISGLAMHGRTEEALRLFHAMRERPDVATLLAVLWACSHAGRVDEGRRYFESMARVYGIRPEIQHYGCMVDMLSRARRLHEALHLVEAMPLRPNDAVWGALLSGCRREGNVRLAASVVDKLMELQPQRVAGHLALLSNMYAAVGRWEEARRARERVARLDVGKPAGRTWVNPTQCSMLER